MFPQIRAFLSLIFLAATIYVADTSMLGNAAILVLALAWRALGYIDGLDENIRISIREAVEQGQEQP